MDFNRTRQVTIRLNGYQTSNIKQQNSLPLCPDRLDRRFPVEAIGCHIAARLGVVPGLAIDRYIRLWIRFPFGCRKGIELGAEFGENVNRRNWSSFVRCHRNWVIWEIGFGRRIDLPPNFKAQERRQKYVRQENGLLARSFCRASFCLYSETRAVAPRLGRGPTSDLSPSHVRRNQGVWF